MRGETCISKLHLTVARHHQGGVAGARAVILLTPGEMDKAGKMTVAYRPAGH